jgi:hypothetical protein
MTPLFARVLNRLPNGYWAGLGFGLAAFAFAAFLLSLMYWAIRPFVWAAVYGVPYAPPPPGPYSPLSGEWLFVQLIWFGSGVVLGRVVYGLSGRHIRWVVLTLTILWLALVIGGSPGQDISWWRVGLSYLKVPLGVVVGYLLWLRSLANTGARQAATN